MISSQSEIYDGKAAMGALLRPEQHPRLGRFPDLLLTYREHARQVRAIRLSKRARVLDVGCSTGTVLRSLWRDYSIEAHGLDVSLRSLTSAASLFPEGRWYRGTVERLPFRKNYFDAVFAFDVLEHVSDFRGALSEIARVLRPGGTVLLHIPVSDMRGSFDSIWKRYCPEQYCAEELEAGHFPENMRAKVDWIAACRAAGLCVEKVQRFNVMLQNIFDYRTRHRLLGRLFNGRRAPFGVYHSLFAPLIELFTVVPDRALAALFDVGASVYIRARCVSSGY